jgi:hypothetical protein
VASRRFTSVIHFLSKRCEGKKIKIASVQAASCALDAAAGEEKETGGREKLSQKLFEKYVGGVQQNTHKCTRQAPLFPSRHRVN